ncbi:hypothetical protein SteCoe_2846 [Stentor coeruleus]|uniref:Uncharacterized protein n=1 Tax=Stentor coeruleus TaxID=5963 RepID=A0A1R2CYI9_9CILI|nr:hypothetical protein SteCoe_2846 [Stentor coeruleus]
MASYFCCEIGCKVLSKVQCSCPGSVLYCDEHFEEHKSRARCRQKCRIEKDVKDFEIECHNQKKFLVSERKKLYKITEDFLKLVNDTVIIVQMHIQEQIEIIKKIRKHYRFQELNKAKQTFHKGSINVKGFNEAIINSLSYLNLECKI